ncbi:CD109 antigen [Trichonephila clavipes]|nr:CD109 antigen [Trichonephila clavipes]
MASLSHQSLTPTELGRVDEEMASPVRFRALPITTGLKAFPDAVDLYMLDPRRTIVRRWLSRQTNLGAVSLEYPLSHQPVYGKWTLQVIAQGQVEEYNFLVEEYYQTRYEINVTMPSFFTDKEEYVFGTIEANYTSGVPVIGNLSLIASIEPHRGNNRVGSAPTLEQHYAIFDGKLDFKFYMREFAELVPHLDKSKVTITAYVGERYLNIIEKGFAEAIIFNSRIKVEFLGDSPQIFKPGMPFRVFGYNGDIRSRVAMVAKLIAHIWRHIATFGGISPNLAPKIKSPNPSPTWR